jgi:hypothetical protein
MLFQLGVSSVTTEPHCHLHDFNLAFILKLVMAWLLPIRVTGAASPTYSTSNVDLNDMHQ